MNINLNKNTWVDETYPDGSSYASTHYWVGILQLLIALVLYVIIIRDVLNGLSDIYTGSYLAVFLTAFVFLLAGVANIVTTLHMRTIARQIVIDDVKCKIEFWYSYNRVKLVFKLDEINQIKQFVVPSGIRGWWRGLVSEIEHYQIILNNGQLFYVSGTISHIEDLMCSLKKPVYPDSID